MILMVLNRRPLPITLRWLDMPEDAHGLMSTCSMPAAALAIHKFMVTSRFATGRSYCVPLSATVCNLETASAMPVAPHIEGFLCHTSSHGGLCQEVDSTVTVLLWATRLTLHTSSARFMKARSASLQDIKFMAPSLLQLDSRRSPRCHASGCHAAA